MKECSFPLLRSRLSCSSSRDRSPPGQGDTERYEDARPDDVRAFFRDGELAQTETAPQPGGDGLVIMPSGTTYTSRGPAGGISRIRPGEPAGLVARHIPGAVSMCYASKAHQLVVPMNPNSGFAFVELGA